MSELTEDPMPPEEEERIDALTEKLADKLILAKKMDTVYRAVAEVDAAYGALDAEQAYTPHWEYCSDEYKAYVREAVQRIIDGHSARSLVPGLSDDTWQRSIVLRDRAELFVSTARAILRAVGVHYRPFIEAVNPNDDELDYLRWIRRIACFDALSQWRLDRLNAQYREDTGREAPEKYRSAILDE